MLRGCSLHTPSRLRVMRGRTDRVDAGADALKLDHIDKDDAGENHAPQEPLAATERSGGFATKPSVCSWSPPHRQGREGSAMPRREPGGDVNDS